MVSLTPDRETISLGKTSGPYIWGKENSTPGVGGSQDDLEWLGESVGPPSASLRAGSAGPESNLRIGGTAEAVPFPELARPYTASDQGFSLDFHLSM